MWDALLNYGNQHPRWFEPMSQYTPEPELLAIYRSQVPQGWRLTRRGLWFISHSPTEPLAQQGWKIHVSSTTESAPDVLSKSLAVLFDFHANFKFLLDRNCLARTSGKRWSRGSSGKFITVYPADDAEFTVIAKELAQVLAGAPGPFILSDRRVPGSSNVYYRYGGFKALNRLQPDGSNILMIADDQGMDSPDIRHPFYSKPAWATDPFDEPQPPPGLPELNNGRYAITGALAYSNAGGVYRALDKTTGDSVVIKEARPNVLVGRRQFSAQDMLIKEFKILTKLAGTQRFAEPVELFTEWEHLFLVEQFIDGEQMSTRSIRSNPLINRNFDRAHLVGYYQEQQRHWLGLLDAIDGAHQRGVMLSDISFTNVLIDAAGQVVIIDLETAIRIGEDMPVGFHTPGVSNAAAQYGDADLTSDFYSLGALMLGSVMLINNAVGYHPPSLDRFLDELALDLTLPPELPAVIRSLMRPVTSEVPDVTALRASIAAIDFAGHDGWVQPTRISLSATEQDGIATVELDWLVTQTTSQIRATADPHRSDRLFPTYLMAYETNAYSLSYGAAGVLHVLKEVDGAVPPQLLAWLLAAEWTNPELCPPGLYSGTAGIAWVLDRLGQQQAAQRALTAAMEHPLAHTDSGILYGTAGLGMACLRLATSGEDSVFAERALSWAVQCGQQLAARAVHDERGAHWLREHGLPPADGSPRPQPVGYGNGASGIALFLLYLSLATGDEQWLTLGRQGLDHDLSWKFHLREDVVEFPPATHDPGLPPDVIRCYWDEGTAGIATTLLRYRAVADDGALRQAWQLMRPDLCRKYTVLPQLFHGLAGLGMALQDAAELIGDESAGLEARRLARGLAMYAVPREDGVAWPSEQCYRESSDLATGAAGVALFLHRLRAPSTGRSSNQNFVLDELLGTRQVRH
ncbi:MAG TPA: class III lanthionine synthetase LanKC [Jatrophihabitans sp.]|jgi:hypothetical protein|uniref:class III lanthionine synthetase LanKC n=1 Tax=Jatrophihabitans sp. TaxID=1932789 RepID=UPI002F003578